MKTLKLLAVSGILAAAAFTAHGEETTLISFTLSTTTPTNITLNGTGTVTVKPQGADSDETVTIGSGSSTVVTIEPETAGETWVITTKDGAGVTRFEKKCDTTEGPIPLTDSNPIKAIDVTGDPALVTLYLRYQQAIETLDLTNNTELRELYVDYNKLKELDLSQNTKLRSVNVSYNLLESLDLSNNPLISTLNCSYNNLTKLDVAHLTDLTQIDITYNNITELDLTKNTKLSSLTISCNPISQVDVSGATGLQQFFAEFCELTSVDISNNSLVTFFLIEGNRLTFNTIKWSEDITRAARYDMYPNDFIACMQRKIEVPHSELYVDLSGYMQPVTFKDVTYPTKLEGFYVYDSATLGTVDDYPYGPWYEPYPFGSDAAREGVKLDSSMYATLKDYKEAHSEAYAATYGSFEQTDLDKKYNISDGIFDVYDTDKDKKVTLYAVLSNELFGEKSDEWTKVPLTLYTTPMEFTISTPTGVENVAVDDREIQAIYDLQGCPRAELQPGVNIVRYTDGTVAKLRR